MLKLDKESHQIHISMKMEMKKIIAVKLKWVLCFHSFLTAG